MASRTTRIVLDMALGAAKNVKYFGATAWRYIKVEAVPPFTGSFFSGPVFQKVEAFVGTVADSFIGSLAGRIQEIDVEAEQVRLERLAAIKALEEKIKADAKRSREEAMKKAAALAAEEAKKIKIEAAKKRTVEITKAQKEDQKEKKEKKEKPKQKEPKGRKRKKPKPKPKPKV